jgi:hypothetical protein
MIALIFIHLPWLVIGTMLTTILVCSQQQLLKSMLIAKRDGTECPPSAIAPWAAPAEHRLGLVVVVDIPASPHN